MHAVKYYMLIADIFGQFLRFTKYMRRNFGDQKILFGPEIFLHSTTCTFRVKFSIYESLSASLRNLRNTNTKFDHTKA